MGCVTKLASRTSSFTCSLMGTRHCSVPMAPRASPASCRTLQCAPQVAQAGVGRGLCGLFCVQRLLVRCVGCCTALGSAALVGCCLCVWLRAHIGCSLALLRTFVSTSIAAASCRWPKQKATSCLNSADGSLMRAAQRTGPQQGVRYLRRPGCRGVCAAVRGCLYVAYLSEGHRALLGLPHSSESTMHGI